MSVIQDKPTSHTVHESSADEHRLRSERIAARGIHLGKGKIRYLIPLVGLAVLASMAFASGS